jgi:NADPH2:quinone reductase
MRGFGPPSVLVLEEVAAPVSSARQVSSDVEVAGITFVETQIRAGKAPRPEMLPRLPAILGNGVGGRVIGSGKRVVTSLNGTGGYAERAVADVAGLIEIPDELSTEDAVALLADGRTALMLAEVAAVQPGERVLVEAAAAGVGSLLVQFARSAGGTCCRGRQRAQVGSDLGADRVVDYTQADWTTQVAGGVDVFDGVGGDIGRAAFELLRPGGRFSAFGMASGTFAQVSDEDAARRSIRLLRGGPPPDREVLLKHVRAALAAAFAGRLKPLIGQRFALEHAADAHAAIEQRATFGKTLLNIH